MHPTTSLSPTHSPAQRRRGNSSRCAKAVALVARQKGLTISLLMCKERGLLPVARARQLAMYLCHVVLGHTLMDIGRFFKRDRTTVSYACALIEDMRDDRQFDDEVTALEHQLESAMTKDEAVHHAA